MRRRKLIAAALFFALFGILSLIPPVLLIFRADTRILGVPLDTVYVFLIWFGLIIGAFIFSKVLPDDTQSSNNVGDDEQ